MPTRTITFCFRCIARRPVLWCVVMYCAVLMAQDTTTTPHTAAPPALSPDSTAAADTMQDSLSPADRPAASHSPSAHEDGGPDSGRAPRASYTAATAADPTHSLKVRFMREYAACHDLDSVPSRVSFDSVLSWKKRLNAWAGASDYTSYVAEYTRAHTTRADAPVRPCEVYQWVLARRRRAFRDSVTAARRRRDSLVIATSRTRNPPSAWDYDAVHFGMQDTVVSLVFAKNGPCRLRHHYEERICRDIVFGNTRVTLRLIFNRARRLGGYTLQSTPVAAHALDSLLRATARTWADTFTTRTGIAPRIHRVSFLDIVPDSIAAYRTWRDGPYRATIGFQEFSDSLSVVARVIDTTFYEPPRHGKK